MDNESEPPVPLDLNEVVKHAITLTKPKWNDQMLIEGQVIEVQTDLQPLPEVMGNKNEILHLLVNLIFNAVDAMPKGGALRIRTHSDDDAGQEGRGSVGLAISDTGTGMSPTVAARCWELFSRRRASREAVSDWESYEIALTGTAAPST